MHSSPLWKRPSSPPPHFHTGFQAPSTYSPIPGSKLFLPYAKPSHSSPLQLLSLTAWCSHLAKDSDESKALAILNPGPFVNCLFTPWHQKLSSHSGHGIQKKEGEGRRWWGEGNQAWGRNEKKKGKNARQNQGWDGGVSGMLCLSGLIIKWILFRGEAHLPKSLLAAEHIKAWIANIYLELTWNRSHQATLEPFPESYLNVLCGRRAQAGTRPGVIG